MPRATASASIVFFIFSASLVHADPPDPCLAAADPAVRRIQLGASVPSYFISVDSPGRHFFWIRNEGGFRNHYSRIPNASEPLQAASAANSYALPDQYDAVPSPDLRWLFTPGIKAYSLPAIFGAPALARDAPLVMHDSQMYGWYESVGLLTRAGDTRVYRIMNDQGGASYRDYRSESQTHIEPLGSVRKACPELLPAHSIALPMISKDGRLFSFYDVKGKSSLIYRLPAEPGAPCVQVADLGIATGKIDFDYSNERIAFHVDSWIRQGSSYFSGMQPTLSRDVFVVRFHMNRAGEPLSIRDWARVTSAPSLGTGSYYPRWTRAGKLAAIHAEAANDYSLALYETDQLVFRPYPFSGAKANTPATLAGGAMWIDACAQKRFGKTSVAPEEQAIFAFQLQGEGCEPFVREQWARQANSIRAKFPGIGLNELLAICSPRRPAAAAAPPAGFSGSACASSAWALAESWGARGEWRTGPGTGPLDRVRRAATARIGHFVEIGEDAAGTLTVRRRSGEATLERSFVAANGCRGELAARIATARAPASGDAVTDEFLSRALGRDTRGSFLVTWSPLMPYSVLGVERIAKLAHDLKLKVVYAADPAASAAVVERTIRAHRLPKEASRRLASAELGARGMTMHYPSVVFVKKDPKGGYAFSDMIPGLHEESDYRALVK